jgi:hypothetical protein
MHPVGLDRKVEPHWRVEPAIPCPRAAGPRDNVGRSVRADYGGWDPP